MPVYTRENLQQLYAAFDQEPPQICLLTGERFLCQQVADQLEQRLLGEGGVLHPLDGEDEDFSQLAGKLRSFNLLPGRQLYKITNTSLFYSKNIAETIWKRAVRAHEKGKTEQAAKALGSFLRAAQLDPAGKDCNPGSLTETEWKKYFGFTRPKKDLGWIDQALVLLQETKPEKKPRGQAADELLLGLFQENLPPANYLMLVAEDVDKRKKLYTYLKKKHTVIDLSVDSGSSAKARKNQQQLLLSLARETLDRFGKSAAPGTLDLLLERVGFYPVALVMELEKVILSIEDRQQITVEDINALVGRTRQEAMYELTTAMTQRNLNQAVTIGTRLQHNGIHPLAIIAGLRNTTRSLLLFRALQAQRRYSYSSSMSASVFQNHCLPLLKKNEQWKNELSGHPFAVYMQFKAAASFSIRELKCWTQLLLDAEMRLKRTPLSAEIILLNLLISMLSVKE
ncbi:MAG: hypothetical protein CSA31_01595 [Desulfobulbus propionicus]|nr:MAG: hypothetical protein CSA31_01595 [Desulfobulbus propionicus]